MTSLSNDISTLNSLIATTIDSVDGYRAAAEDSDGRFAGLFTDCAAERERACRSLQAEVSRLGGDPEDDGTVLAAAHRAFMGLKDAVTGRDEQAIVNEVERGEDHIKEKFESALNDNNVSLPTRAVIAEAYGSVRAGHDRMRDLKHSLQAAH